MMTSSPQLPFPGVPPTHRAPTIFPADALPDYRPPLPVNPVRADADGNLRIRFVPMKPIPSRRRVERRAPPGELVDRIPLPPGYRRAGFGAGRIVYLTMRDTAGLHRAKERLK
jgi:hypothetical protein